MKHSVHCVELKNSRDSVVVGCHIVVEDLERCSSTTLVWVRASSASSIGSDQIKLAMFYVNSTAYQLGGKGHYSQENDKSCMAVVNDILQDEVG